MNPILKQIIRGIGAVAVSNVVGRLSSFTTVVLLTTALSLYEYGLVMLALAITGPVLAIMSLGLDDMILADTARYLADGKKSHAKRMLSGYLAVKAVLLIMLVIGGYIFRDFLATKYGQLITDATLILLLYVILQYFRTSYNTILHIHKRFKTLAFWNSVEPIARLIFVAVAFAVGGINVMVALASYVASSAVTIVGSTPQLLAIGRTYLRVPKLRQPIFRAAMKAHGKWQSALSMLGSFTGAAGVYIIKILLSTEAVAIFAVAQSMFSAIASLTPIKTVMVPFISQWSTNKERLNQVLKKITKYSMLMYAAILIASVSIGPSIINVFFPKYTASILVFQILTIRLLLNTFSITQSPTLTFEYIKITHVDSDSSTFNIEVWSGRCSAGNHNLNSTHRTYPRMEAQNKTWHHNHNNTIIFHLRSHRSNDSKPNETVRIHHKTETPTTLAKIGKLR